MAGCTGGDGDHDRGGAANEAPIVANAAGNPAALIIQPMTATHSDPTS